MPDSGYGMDELREPPRLSLLRALLAMPTDTNPKGDIFGAGSEYSLPSYAW